MQLQTQDDLIKLHDHEVSEAPLLRDVAEQFATEVVRVPFVAAAVKAWTQFLSGAHSQSDFDAESVMHALQVGYSADFVMLAAFAIQTRVQFCCMLLCCSHAPLIAANSLCFPWFTFAVCVCFSAGTHRAG